jgi:hypothetical protein
LYAEDLEELRADADGADTLGLPFASQVHLLGAHRRDRLERAVPAKVIGEIRG